MMTNKITLSVDQNKWSNLNKPTNQNSVVKVPNVVKPRNKETLLQNFGD